MWKRRREEEKVISLTPELHQLRSVFKGLLPSTSAPGWQLCDPTRTCMPGTALRVDHLIHRAHSVSQQSPVSAISEGNCEIPLDLQSHLQAHLSLQKEYFYRSSCSLHFSVLLLAYLLTDEELIEVSPIPRGRSLGT